MSTRSTNLRNSSAKKIKMSELSPFWDDDDWDGDSIDDCFRKATQEITKENDVTLLSSYSVFKAPQHIVTSTQCEPSNSTNTNFKDTLTELRAKYAEKEGEASILRSNLENLRTSYQTDQERKQMEWKEKLSISEKEKKTIKSELEFKNFEIVNLKQQIAELTRLVNGEQNFMQRSHLSEIKSIAPSPEKRQEAPANGNLRICINLEKYYPLQSFGISFRSKTFQKKNFCGPQSANSSLGDFNCSYIYQEFIPLTKLSSDELSSNKSISYINKVLWSAYELLNIFHDHLKDIKVKCSLGQAEEISVQDLQITSLSFLCSEVLEFLQKIVPFNVHLKKCLLTEQLVHLDDIPNLNSLIKEMRKSHLVLLLDTVTIIGQIGKEKDCHNFLSALLKLLCTIYSSEDVTYLRKDTIKAISKELLTLNLCLEVIDHVNIFLNVVIRNASTFSFLCSKEVNMSNSSKGSCRFAEYIISLEKSLMKIDDSRVFLKLTENILNLTYNIFEFDVTHQNETKTCDCVIKLYKLTVRIIYRNLEAYDPCLDKNKFILKKHIKMLSLLIFNAYDLTQKYVTDFAQFKEIMYTFRNADIGNVNLKNLEKLSASEEFPLVQKEKFSSITF